jgi:hypothetical protein
MITEPLDVLPLWLLDVCFGLALWGTLEAGYRAGRWRHVHKPDEQVQQVGAIVASILGLLALVLGFTFSFAASRFDARREAVLEEANAIGTTYLRTRLLSPDLRKQSAAALKEYVDVRLHGVRSGDPTAAIARSEELHEVLWSQAAIAGQENPTSEMVALYIDSLNKVIDMHEVRVQAGTRSRIPVVMWSGLLVMSLLSLAAVGYQSGLSNTRRSPVKLVMILAFTIVLALIADLDRSQQGLLRVGQQAMVDVQKMIQASPH